MPVKAAEKSTHMLQRLHSFIYGITLPYQAGRLIVSSKTLLLLSCVPIAVTVIFYRYLIQYLQNQAHGLLDGILASHQFDLHGWFAAIIFFLVHLLIFLVSAVTFSSISNMIASPFNDFLAEQTEKRATPPLPSAGHQSLIQKARLIGLDLAKALAATSLSLLALLLSWVPIVNIVTFLAAFLLISFQYTSYPQTRRGLSLREGLWFLFQHFYACAGFGLSLSVLFAIPVLSCLFLPVAVVGGTLLVARAQKNPSLPWLY